MVLRALPVLLVWLALAPPARADDRVLSAQTVLKAQGYYFGEVDGKTSEETEQALRRFQIRNLLPVTGQLDANTTSVLNALGAAHRPPQNSAAKVGRGIDASVATPPPARTTPPPVTSAPPASAPTLAPSAAAPVPSAAAPTPPAPAPETRLHLPPAIGAEPAVEPPDRPAAARPSALARAQELLQRDGWYEGEIDGRDGSRTRTALLDFQLASELPPTGRLDGSTMAALGIDPAEYTAPAPRRSRHARRGGLRIFGIRLGWR